MNLQEFKSTTATPTTSQILFSQLPRGESKGYKVLFDLPPSLTTDLQGNHGLIYRIGLNSLVTKHLKDWIKSNSPSYGTTVPTLTDERITELTTPATSKQLTKDSIAELFDSSLLPLVVNLAVDSGLEDQAVEQAVQAYKSFFLKLASPSISYPPEVVTKLTNLVEAVEFDTPTSEALLTRLNGMNKQDLASLLV